MGAARQYRTGELDEFYWPSRRRGQFRVQQRGLRGLSCTVHALEDNEGAASCHGCSVCVGHELKLYAV